MTTPYNMADYLCDLYVWGNNHNSELGIIDEQAESLPADTYNKHHLKRPLKNLSYKNGGILQLALGNATSLLVYAEKEFSEISILQTG